MRFAEFWVCCRSNWMCIERVAFWWSWLFLRLRFRFFLQLLRRLFQWSFWICRRYLAFCATFILSLVTFHRFYAFVSAVGNIWVLGHLYQMRYFLFFFCFFLFSLVLWAIILIDRLLDFFVRFEEIYNFLMIDPIPIDFIFLIFYTVQVVLHDNLLP